MFGKPSLWIERFIAEIAIVISFLRTERAKRPDLYPKCDGKTSHSDTLYDLFGKNVESFSFEEIVERLERHIDFLLETRPDPSHPAIDLRASLAERDLLASCKRLFSHLASIHTLEQKWREASRHEDPDFRNAEDTAGS